MLEIIKIEHIKGFILYTVCSSRYFVESQGNWGWQTPLEVTKLLLRAGLIPRLDQAGQASSL